MPVAQTSGGRTTWPPATSGRSRPSVTSTGLVRQRIEPPPLWNSRDVDLDDLEAPVGQLRPDPLRAAGGHHDGAADHDRVRAERRQRLVVGEHQRLGHQLEQGRGGGVVEGARRDHRASLVERAEGQVEVVHRGVGDPHATHPDAEVGGEVLERQLLGARTEARRPARRPRRRRRRPRGARRRRRDRRTTWRGRCARTTAAPSASPSGARRTACGTARRADAPSGRTTPRPRFIA